MHRSGDAVGMMSACLHRRLENMETEIMEREKQSARWKIVSMIARRALMLILIVVVFLMMLQISYLQGTARVINYAGIVRGATQREVKLEIAGHQNDALSGRLDSILIELKSGAGSNQLVSLQDKEYQHHLDVQIAYWEELKKEIEKVRRYGYEHTEIIEMSEAYFELADQTVSAAEHYSEKIAQHIRTLEIISAVDMLLLLLMMVRSTMVSVRISRMNKQLEKKAYLDLHTPVFRI